MNLRDLQYLIAVAEHRHFRKAAEACFVSQPTLSGQLKKLEETLKVRLFERDSRNVLLTDAGEAIAYQARRVIAEVSQLTEIAAGFNKPMSGRIKLGLIPTIAPYLCPHIMPALSRRYPDLELLLVEAQTSVLLEGLEAGDLDVLVLAEVDGLGRFTSEPLYEEPLVLATPKDHPLARRRNITLDDLDGQQVLLLSDGHCLRKDAMDICFSAGAVEDKHFQATSLETLRHMVGAGTGITLIPQLAVDSVLQFRAGPVAYTPFAAPKPTRQVVLVHRTSFARADCAHQIAAGIREIMADRLAS
jgi:LysR family hydrogen peroxide-inducible transcriptional activator